MVRPPDNLVHRDERGILFLLSVLDSFCKPHGQVWLSIERLQLSALTHALRWMDSPTKFLSESPKVDTSIHMWICRFVYIYIYVWMYIGP